MKKSNNKLNKHHKFPKTKFKTGFGEVIYSVTESARYSSRKTCYSSFALWAPLHCYCPFLISL